MSKRFLHPALSAPAETAPPALADALDADEIRRQLERILASDQFHDSLQLTRFLAFVVETALAGKTNSIKAYTIAVEALGRSSDFDPQNDPIVRVEAGRLRLAMARYYAESGRDDPLLIDLPRGSYVPGFQRRKQDAAPSPGQKTAALPEAHSPAAQSTADMPDLAERFYPFGQDVSEFLDLAAARRRQVASFANELLSTRQTLNQSRDLLHRSLRLLSENNNLTREAAAAASTPVADSENGESQEPFAGAIEAEIGATSESPDAEQAGEVQPVGRRATFSRLVKTAIAPVQRAGPLLKCLAAAIAILAVLEVVFDIDRPLFGGPNHGLWYQLASAPNPAVSQPPSSEGSPTIYVEPVTTAGQEVEGLFPAKVIRERLIDALARYDDVTVVTAEPPIAANGGAAAADARGPRSIYRLAATVRYGDQTASLIVHLIDAADSAIVWSRQYDRPVNPPARRPHNTIAPDVARSLLDPFGVIEARERVKLAAADPMRDTYRCLLDANLYLRSFDPSQYQPVHDCLVRATTDDPPAVTVFADLAFVYLRNYRLGILAQPGDRTALDNAYAMASRAIDVKPNSAYAQYALQEVLLAKGDIARASIAGDNSFRLNPNDGAVAFGHAELLIVTGQVDAGLALLASTTAKSPNGWIGYHMLMALGCYLKGDLKTAGAEAGQIATPYFPPGLMLDTLVANKAGDRSQARQDITMLYQFYPGWRDSYRASIARYLPEPAMAQRIAADFKAAVDATR